MNLRTYVNTLQQFLDKNENLGFIEIKHNSSDKENILGTPSEYVSLDEELSNINHIIQSKI